MANRVPLLGEPADLTNPIAVADWLEIKCLRASDQNISRGDLERLLKRASVFDGQNADEDAQIDGYCLTVFEELEFRAASLGDFYPFELKSSLLSRRKRYCSPYASYLFCLCLSYFGDRATSAKNLNPRLLFEELCAAASEGFFAGTTLVFGTGRYQSAKAIKGFARAVDHLARFLNEGNGLRPKQTLNKKDDHVDLVTIRRVDQLRQSNLIIFGQCASGNNWPEKTSELMPSEFWSQWMKEPNVSPLCRAFFIPHCLSEDSFNYNARRAGYFFDRIRTAMWAAQSARFGSCAKSYESWIALQI